MADEDRLLCDPGVAACLRITSAVIGRLIGDGLLPGFIDALRDLIPAASCPVEAEILATFVVAVERGIVPKPTAPKLRLIHDGNFRDVENQGLTT
jgi:hypothetical protein